MFFSKRIDLQLTSDKESSPCQSLHGRECASTAHTLNISLKHAKDQ